MWVEFSPGLVCACGIPHFSPTACGEDVHANNEHVAGWLQDWDPSHASVTAELRRGGKKGSGGLRHHLSRQIKPCP